MRSPRIIELRSAIQDGVKGVLVKYRYNKGGDSENDFPNHTDFVVGAMEVVIVTIHTQHRKALILAREATQAEMDQYL
jgi:hypothetical protein